ncbi:class I SAM-dependent methyltransferase [Lysinibacillus sp. NPDC097195]|uniref:class I SAM-dependent methyltransferase n=1 Tax=Lysinibacillus sp. NPDC097195 TaxID=3364141 RepID=UPI00381D9FE1
MEKKILDDENLLAMLDDLLREPKGFWENFYEDRNKDIPFFKVTGPDENLVEYFSKGLSPQKVLEVGCGPGRNSTYMAQQGCHVSALDISEKAIIWAKERANEEALNIDFHCVSLFDYDFETHSYDFIYDCGLFHHLPPHRRLTYLKIIKKALKKDGHYGLVCFNTAGAANTSDWDIYKEQSLKGGIGYTEERLKEIFEKDFNIKDFRKMRKSNKRLDLFGENFLWTSLMQIKNDC